MQVGIEVVKRIHESVREFDKLIADYKKARIILDGNKPHKNSGLVNMAYERCLELLGCSLEVDRGIDNCESSVSACRDMTEPERSNKLQSVIMALENHLYDLTETNAVLASTVTRLSDRIGRYIRLRTLSSLANA